MKCPKCGAEVKPGSLYCGECLQEIHWVPEYNTVETLLNKEKKAKMQMLKKQAKHLEELSRRTMPSLKKRVLACLAVLSAVLLAGAGWVPGQLPAYGAESSIIETLTVTFKTTYGEQEEIPEPERRHLFLSSGNVRRSILISFVSITLITKRISGK